VVPNWGPKIGVHIGAYKRGSILRVQNGGRYCGFILGSKLRVHIYDPTRGPKLGSQIWVLYLGFKTGVHIEGTKCGSKIGVDIWGQYSGSKMGGHIGGPNWRCIFAMQVKISYFGKF
jgi:hypothetical protein